MLLVFDTLDAEGYAHALAADAVADGVRSFERFPALAAELSGGEARVSYDVVRASRTLRTLTDMGDGRWWPSPADVAPELREWAPPGRYDSVLVLWPLLDPGSGSSVPSGGWGLALGATGWAGGATYATVGSAPPEVWAVPRAGEVWMHEWLHGACDVYARRGFAMPPGDADGAERAGYVRSPVDGWCAYYRDLMTGRVMVDGEPRGIPPEAWRTGAVHDRPPRSR